MARLYFKKRIKRIIDWEKIDKHAYLSAMERSPINDLEIKTLLKTHLSDDIFNQQTLIKGIVQSYYYEGLEKPIQP